MKGYVISLARVADVIKTKSVFSCKWRFLVRSASANANVMIITHIMIANEGHNSNVLRGRI